MLANLYRITKKLWPSLTEKKKGINSYRWQWGRLSWPVVPWPHWRPHTHSYPPASWLPIEWWECHSQQTSTRPVWGGGWRTCCSRPFPPCRRGPTPGYCWWGSPHPAGDWGGLCQEWWQPPGWSCRPAPCRWGVSSNLWWVWGSHLPGSGGRFGPLGGHFGCRVRWPSGVPLRVKRSDIT